MMQRAMFCGLFITGLVVAGTSLEGQQGTKGGEWRYHGGDQGYTRYSPLDQINKDNVKNLRIAWRRPAVAEEFQAAHPGLKFGARFNSTPLMINGVLYGSNGIGLVEALDPVSGKTLWVQELPEDTPEALNGSSSRGIGYWKSGNEESILSVRAPYLIATDLKTGKLVRSFGERGKVDLRIFADPPNVATYRWGSAPLVVRDVVIVGATTLPRPSDVRGYDVRTGKLRWTFHVIPRDGEFGADTWLEGSNKGIQAGNGAVYPMMSADEELGLVYLPTSAATNDTYGGDRPGNNLFSSSIVCIRADTGERVWHFQTVHHDLWDYDNPVSPMLIDINVNGRVIKAAVQLTKQGFAFVFDRVTGEPVWRIEERPVPKSTVLGEWTSPTQPFPTKPAPVERQGISTDDLIDFTPELRAEALEFAKRYVLGPLFTPPTTKDEPKGNEGILQFPGMTGGPQWGGGAFDLETGILYVPSRTNPWRVLLLPRNPEDKISPTGGTEVKCCARYLGGFEARGVIAGPRDLPLTKPPYGRITAINMSTGDHLWMVPNGDGPRDHPALKDLKLPPLGSPGQGMPLVTKTLLFVSEGNVGNIVGGGPTAGKKVRAFDKASGAVVWEFELPDGNNGSLMTYMHNGKQYIVMPVGSGNASAEWVALSLP